MNLHSIPYSRGGGPARCRGFGTCGWEVVGRTWTRRPSIPYRGVVRREGSGLQLEELHVWFSARKADSDTVPEVALRSSPSATERNGRHHGLRAGHQSPEANCRQFICFSPLLHRLPRQAPISAAFDGRRASGPGTTAGHHWSAWCYVTSTGRRVIKPVR